jgi:hypothetical protein
MREIVREIVIVRNIKRPFTRKPLLNFREPSRAEEHFKNKNGGEAKINPTGGCHQANSASDQQAENWN